MRGLWGRWVAWLDRRESAHAVALTRMAVGLTLLVTLGDIVAAGVVELLYLPPEHGGFKPISEDHWLIDLLGGATPAAVRGLLWAGIALSASLAMGLGGWLTPLLLLQVTMALFSLHSASGGGHDRVLFNSLFLLIFARGSATWSLDARLRHGVWDRDASVPAWPRALIAYQLVLIYFNTGVQKIGEEWMPWGGLSALYYALQLPEWMRFDASFVADQPWYLLTQIGTAVTLLFEDTSPLLLLAVWWAETPERPGRLRALSNRLRLRDLYVATGVALHGLIFLTMNVGPFSPAMLSLYFCLYPPAAYRHLRDRAIRHTTAPKTHTSAASWPQKPRF